MIKKCILIASLVFNIVCFSGATSAWIGSDLSTLANEPNSCFEDSVTFEEIVGRHIVELVRQVTKGVAALDAFVVEEFIHKASGSFWDDN